MKKIIMCVLVTLFSMLMCASYAQAVGPLMVGPHTARWDANSDGGLTTGYYVYYRLQATPANPWVDTQRSALIPQTATPTYDLTQLITVNGSYEFMVEATDTDGDISGPSNIVPFVLNLPGAPKNAGKQ